MQGKHILVITRQIAYSIRLEEALEQIGFEVDCFASAHNALEEAHKTHFDLAIVDFMVADMVGDEIVRRLRELQPHIAIIVSPDLAIVRALQAPMNIQVVLNLPIKARHLVPRLQAAIRMMNPNASFPKLPPSKRPLKSLPSKPSKAEWVIDNRGIASLLMEDEPALSPEELEQSRQLFERMKNQEPPPPSFDESVTVHDILRTLEHLSEGQATRELDVNQASDLEVDTSPSESVASPATPAPTPSPQPSLPQRILEEAFSAGTSPTPPEGFSLAKFLERVQERPTDPPLQALPSWLKQDQTRFVSEPEFLPPLPSPDPESAYSASDTYDVLQTPAPDLTHQRTDRLEPVRRSKPTDAAATPASDSQALARLGEAHTDAPLTPSVLPAQAEGQMDDYAQAALSALDDSDSLSEEDTPFLLGAETLEERMAARFALALADLAQENAAESCILARHGRVIEVRGRLPRAIVETLGEALTPPLSTDKPTRVRYDVEVLGAQYILCSVLSVDDFVLSLLYAGTQNLSAMRLQAKRLETAILNTPEPPTGEHASEATQDEQAPPLAEALQKNLPEALPPAPAVPASESVPEVPPPAPAKAPLATTAYTFVWLLREGETALNDILGAELEEQLSQQLQQASWQVHNLSVYADAVYLYADVPNTTQKPLDILHSLMARASEIMRHLEPSRTAPLWSESYLLLTPGRSLSEEELHDFVSFARD